jgi:hypothetical protein
MTNPMMESDHTDSIHHPHNNDKGQKKSRPVVQIVGLYQGSGTHYVDVWCGTPIPQRQTVIVDTGSASTAFACTPYCTPSRCGHHLAQYHPLYAPIQSQSYRKVSSCADCVLGECVVATSPPSSSSNHKNDQPEQEECVWGTAYQEGSNWTAFEAIDTCYIGGLHTQPLRTTTTTTTAESEPRDTEMNQHTVSTDGVDPYRAAMDYRFDLRFGCQTQLAGNFRTQDTAGIMGLDIGNAAVWNQMFLQQIIPAPSFSLCFTRPNAQSRSLSNNAIAGAMTLGGTDPRFHRHGMVYSASSQEHDDRVGFFSVQLHKMYLRQGGGGDSVASADVNAKVVSVDIPDQYFEDGRIIIDSGTTDSYFLHK